MSNHPRDLPDENAQESKVLDMSYEAIHAENLTLKKELQRTKALYEQQLDDVSQLYGKLTGEPSNQKWSIRDYALAIYYYLDNIIAHAPGHIFWIDKNNHYLGCNDEHAKTAGLASRHMITGKTNADLSWSGSAEYLDDINRKVMETAKPSIMEEDGDTVYGYQVYLVHKTPLRNQIGEIIGLLATGLNITEKKQVIEELSQAKKSLEQMNIEREHYVQGIQQKLLPQMRLLISGSEELLQEQKDNSTRFKLEALHEAAEKLKVFFNEIVFYNSK